MKVYVTKSGSPSGDLLAKASGISKASPSEIQLAENGTILIWGGIETDEYKETLLDTDQKKFVGNLPLHVGTFEKASIEQRRALGVKGCPVHIARSHDWAMGDIINMFDTDRDNLYLFSQTGYGPLTSTSQLSSDQGGQLILSKSDFVDDDEIQHVGRAYVVGKKVLFKSGGASMARIYDSSTEAVKLPKAITNRLVGFVNDLNLTFAALDVVITTSHVTVMNLLVNPGLKGKPDVIDFLVDAFELRAETPITRRAEARPTPEPRTSRPAQTTPPSFKSQMESLINRADERGAEAILNILRKATAQREVE